MASSLEDLGAPLEGVGSELILELGDNQEWNGASPLPRPAAHFADDFEPHLDVLTETALKNREEISEAASLLPSVILDKVSHGSSKGPSTASHSSNASLSGESGGFGGACGCLSG